MSDIHTVKDASKLTGLSQKTIRRYIHSGTLKHELIDGRYFVPDSEIKGLVKPLPEVYTRSIAELPDIEPMQDLLAQINKTFVQFSEQNSVTAQGIAQEYSRSVRPIVQKVTGETAPEMTYDALRAEFMDFVQKPLHRMITNMMLIKKAIEDNPQLEDMPLPEALDWFLTAMLNGLDTEGINIPEPVRKGMKQAYLEQSQK